MNMPVTTKAQLSAESEDCVNSFNPREHEFLSKIKKSAKSRDIPIGHLTPTCGAKTLRKSKAEAADDGGLSRLCRFLCQTV
jgi:hypothetical protein